MTNLEFVEALIKIAGMPTYYRNKYPENCGYNNGSKWGYDCIGLIKATMSGWMPHAEKGSFCSPAKFICGDISEAGLLNGCTRKGKELKDLPAYGSLLYMSGHCGIYVGEHIIEGKTYNAIECTTSYSASKVTWAWFDLDGTRRAYKGGAKSAKNGQIGE